MSAVDTANELVRCCRDDEFPSLAVITDFFGKNKAEYHQCILGVYIGLVNHFGVDAQTLTTYFKNNKLDQLIHAKYQRRPSGHYQTFCRNNIRIGNTYLAQPLEMKQCPSCQANEYQNNKTNPPECAKCYTLICTKCVVVDDECYYCSGCANELLSS